MPCATQELQNKYCREHYRSVHGFKLITAGRYPTVDGGSVWLTPKMLLTHKTATQPFTVYGKPSLVVHVPRTMLVRTKIQVRK
jgi:hypothetical protein